MSGGDLQSRVVGGGWKSVEHSLQEELPWRSPFDHITEGQPLKPENFPGATNVRISRLGLVPPCHKLTKKVIQIDSVLSKREGGELALELL